MKINQRKIYGRPFTTVVEMENGSVICASSENKGSTASPAAEKKKNATSEESQKKEELSKIVFSLESKKRYERQREIQNSIYAIWPYGEHKLLALAEEQDGKNDCYLVWIEVDEKERIIIRAGALSWVATVKNSGLYALRNDDVIILTKDYLKIGDTTYYLAKEGIVKDSFTLLESMGDMEFVKGAIDIDCSDQLDFAPRFHFSYNDGVLHSPNDDVLQSLYPAYFLTMKDDESVIYSQPMLWAYVNEKALFERASRSFDHFIIAKKENRLSESDKSEFLSILGELHESLVNLKEGSKTDFNDVAISDEPIAFAEQVVKVNCVMPIINRIFFGKEDILRFYPTACSVDGQNISFIFTVYVKEYRMTDYDLQQYLDTIKARAFLEMITGFNNAAESISLVISIDNLQRISISYMSISDEVTRVSFQSVK